MSPSEEDRARARVNWPIRRYRLGEEPADDLRQATTAEQRLAMVAELSREAWRLSGRPIPDYSRAETPIRVVRLGDDGAAGR